MRKWISLALLFPLLGISILYLPGCMEVQKHRALSEEEAQTKAQETQMEYDFKEGHMSIKVLEKDHIAGEFKSNENISVGFEAIRVGETPLDAKLFDKDAPNFIVDARFVSIVSGEHFDIRFGGHSTHKDTKRHFGEAPNCHMLDCEGVSQNFRDKEFEITKIIADKLQEIKKDLPEFIHFEIENLIEMGSFEPDWNQKGDADKYIDEDGNEVPFSYEDNQSSARAFKSSSNYIHNVDVYYKYVGGSTRAQHSSTYIYSSQGYRIYNVSETCNHGTCARSWRMRGLWCREQSLNRWQWLPHYAECGRSISIDSGHGWICCNSRYGTWSGRHVCNDDSKLQLDSVRDQISILPYYCRDRSMRWTAPYCRSPR